MSATIDPASDNAATPLAGQASKYKALPVNMPGHWSTPEGREKALEYAELRREDLGFGDRPDLGLANAVFLVGRNDLDLIVYQTAAKERIRWLSVQLALALAALRPFADAAQHVPADQGDFKVVGHVPGGAHATEYRKLSGHLTAGNFRTAAALSQRLLNAGQALNGVAAQTPAKQSGSTP